MIVFTVAMLITPFLSGAKANALELTCDELLGSNATYFWYAMAPDGVSYAGNTSAEAHDWLARCKVEMTKDPCKSASITNSTTFNSCLNALKAITADIMGVPSLDDPQVVEFDRLCTELGGKYYFTKINGSTPKHYCQMIGGQTAEAAPGASTLSEAIVVLEKRLEIKRCNDTPGKTWDTEKGECVDIQYGTGPGQASTCVGTSFFGEEICAEDGNIIQNTIIAILNWALIGVGTVVVIIVVVGGIQYMTAAGNAETTKKARTMIMNAILALVLYVVMITILNFVIPGGVFSGT